MLRLVFDAVSMQAAHKIVVQNCSFKVPTGHIHAIVGSSRSGKSALLLLAAGQIEANHGQVYVESIDKMPAPERDPLDNSEEDSQVEQGAASGGTNRKPANPATILPVSRHLVALGPIHKYAPLFDTLTVREQLYFQAKLIHQRDAKMRVEALMEQYQLRELAKERCKDLDQYAYFRTSLALTRIANPPFILLDEPDRGLSAEEWCNAVSLLRAVADAGCGIVLTSVIETVAKDADSALILATGEVRTTCQSSKSFVLN